MRPPSDLLLKGRAVEEWIDLKFFRPMGGRIARVLAPTGISANQVTLASVLIGLVAGHLFVYRDRWINVLGVLLFILSDMFDSADGQLARLRGTSSRFGRALDGIGDNVRFINLYVHLTIRLVSTGFGWPSLLLVLLAGVAHSLQSAAVDFVRNAFLAAGLGEGGELDLPEDVEAVREAGVFASFSARAYRDYVGRQALLFPRSVRLIRLLRRVEPSETWRSEYRERQQVLLPLCGWLGTNIRIALLAWVALAGHASLFLWAEVLPMNLVLLVLLIAHEWNATAMGESLESGPDVYATAG